jgi:hypothetical protein
MSETSFQATIKVDLGGAQKQRHLGELLKKVFLVTKSLKFDLRRVLDKLLKMLLAR